MSKFRLYKSIDIAPLVLFRMLFGFLMFGQILYYLYNGFVRRNFVNPIFTFSHIGMDWLQPIPGNGMYFYFGIMSAVLLMIGIGWKYRINIIVFTLLWAGVYFMQKTTYNNHYYLILLLGFLMCLMPAGNYASVDSRLNPSITRQSMPYGCALVFILQIAIVYFFASVAKLYSGWLDGSFVKSMLAGSGLKFPELYAQPWFYLFISYAGLAFDFLIVPMLLWKKTRNFAFIASILFHLFNKANLSIGVFPFLSLSFIVFFYEPETVRKIFFPKKPTVTENENRYGKSWMAFIFIPYFIVQLVLPVRHYFIKGDVLWTEEGHRLSWRMMARTRSGSTHFKIIDNRTNEVLTYKLRKRITKQQIKGMQSKPDMIWQMAQYIKAEFAEKGKNVRIYADTKVSINHTKSRRLINPNVDLGKATWNYFWHNDWILLYDENGNLIN